VSVFDSLHKLKHKTFGVHRDSNKRVSDFDPKATILTQDELKEFAGEESEQPLIKLDTNNNRGAFNTIKIDV